MDIEGRPVEKALCFGEFSVCTCDDFMLAGVELSDKDLNGDAYCVGNLAIFDIVEDGISLDLDLQLEGEITGGHDDLFVKISDGDVVPVKLFQFCRGLKRFAIGVEVSPDRVSADKPVVPCRQIAPSSFGVRLGCLDALVLTSYRGRPGSVSEKDVSQLLDSLSDSIEESPGEASGSTKWEPEVVEEHDEPSVEVTVTQDATDDKPLTEKAEAAEAAA